MSIFYILIHTVTYAEILSVDKVVKTSTVEDIKEKSKDLEFNILTAKTLDFEKINEHQNILFGYGLLEENISFQQKVVQRSIELYGVDSLEMKITYLYLAYAYLLNHDSPSAEPIYIYINETKDNMNYENNISLLNTLNRVKAEYKILQKKYKDAQHIMYLHLQMFEKHKEFDSINYIRDLKRMAVIENALGYYNKAFEYLKKGSKILVQNKIYFSLNEKIETQLLIADIDENQEKYQGTIAALKVAYTQIKESNETLSPINSIEMWYRTCKMSLVTKEYETSKHMVSNIMLLQEKLSLKETVSTISSMVCLGAAEKSLGHYTEAKLAYKKALYKLNTAVYIQNYNQEKKILSYKINQSIKEIIELEKQINKIKSSIPEILYLAIDGSMLAIALKKGLKAPIGDYIHVHKDKENALKVKKRKKNVVVLKIDAKQMIQDNHKFYETTKDELLVKKLISKYLSQDL